MTRACLPALLPEANYCMHQTGRAASGPHGPRPVGRARPAGDACVMLTGRPSLSTWGAT
jgi:hypothetical protein